MTHVGDGSTSRKISLGFKPSCVIVTNKQQQFFYDDANGINKYCYSGIATQNFTPALLGDETNGTLIKIIDDGFEIYYHQAKLGSSYNYRAWTNSDTENYNAIIFIA